MKVQLRPGLTRTVRSQEIQQRVDADRVKRFTENRFSKAEDDPSRLSVAEITGLLLVIPIIGIWILGMAAGFQTAVTILTILGFILVISGLFVPALGLLGIGLLSTLDAATRNFVLTGGILRWNTLNYWLLIVIALNLMFVLRLNNLQTRLLEIFVALLAVELLISSAPSIGVQDVLNILSAFGILYYFAKGFQIKGGLYWMAILSSLTSALGGLVFFQQISQLPYVNPNSWTFFPLTGIFAICLGFPSAKDHRAGTPILLMLAAVNFLWIFLSGSRGSMLVGALCLVFLFLWTRKLTWKLAFIGLGWVAFAVIGVLFVEEQTHAAARIEKLFNDNLTLAQKTSGRTAIAEAGFGIFLENPLGVGTGSFRDTISDNTGFTTSQVAAHSGLVKILAENGIPGILLLTAYLLSFMYVGIQRKNRDLFLLGLLVTSSFTAALLAKEFQGKGLWFFAAGATVLLHPDEMVQILSHKSRLLAESAAARVRRFRSGRFS